MTVQIFPSEEIFVAIRTVIFVFTMFLFYVMLQPVVSFWTINTIRVFLFVIPPRSFE